jgi:hypothetical protein
MLILKAIQHNCRRSGDVLHAALETRLKRKVDIVLVREPPADRRYQHSEFIFYWAEGE